jgi:branched-chain amino acid transport system permease protein
MVNLELRRDRMVARFRDKKSEWVIEPRYWRNPIIGIGILLILPIFVQSYPHLLTMITTANLYAAIAIPLSLQMLGTGRVNFGPQLYLGIGGYTAALLNLHFGWSPALTLMATITVCGVISLLLSPTTLIAKGLYFSLITLILPLTFMDVTFIWGDIFRGEVGLVGMSPLLTFQKVSWNYIAYYYLSLFLMLLYLLVSDRIVRSRFGINLAAINENENVARMMGVRVNLYKVMYYMFPSILTGIAGWFIVHTFRTFAGVTYLPLEFMTKILIIVIVGGRAFLYGAIPGAYLISIIEDSLRGFGPVNYFLFPLVLIALIVFLPRGEGLWGLYHKKRPRDYFPKLHVRRE